MIILAFLEVAVYTIGPLVAAMKNNLTIIAEGISIQPLE